MSHEVNPGAETITYYSYEKTGFAKIIANYSTDLSSAAVAVEEQSIWCKVSIC